MTINIPNQEPITREAHDKLVADFDSQQPKDVTLTSTVALDVLETALTASENTLLTEVDGDSEASFAETFQSALFSASQGQDVKESHSDVHDQADAIDNGVALEQLGTILSDPDTPIQEKISLAQYTEAVQEKSSRLLNDVSAAKSIYLSGELSKHVDGYSLLEAWKDNAAPKVTGDVTLDEGFSKKIFPNAKTHDESMRSMEGLFSRYIHEILFIPQAVGAIGQDVFSGLTTSDRDAENFPNLMEVMEESAIFDAYLTDRAAKDPEGFGAGDPLGYGLSFVLDPVVDIAIAKPIVWTVKAVSRVTKTIRTGNKLRKAFGTTAATKIVKSSHKELVKTMQDGGDELIMELSKFAESNNPLSNKIKAAVIEAAGDRVIKVEMTEAVSAGAKLVNAAIKSGDSEALDQVENAVLTVTSKDAPPTADTIKTALGSGDFTHAMLVGVDDVVVKAPLTDYGIKMNNSAAMKPVVDTIQYKVLTKAQSIVEGVQRIRITKGLDDLEELNFGVSAGGWSGKVRNRFIQATLPMTSLFKGAAKRELVDNVTVVKQVEKLVRAGHGAMHDAVWKGLSKAETKQLGDMAAMANDLESWGKIIDGQLIFTDEVGKVVSKVTTSPKLLDRYVARQRMMGHIKNNVNDTMRRAAQGRGVKLYNGTNLVRKIAEVPDGFQVFDAAGNPVSFNTSMRDNGFELYRVDGLEDDGFIVALDPDLAQQKIKDIPNDYEMMDGAVEGYMRLEYPAKYRLVEVKFNEVDPSMPTELGETIVTAPKVTPFATADTAREADLLIAKGKREGKTYLSMRAEPGQIDASYGANFVNSFISMSDEQATLFLRNLAQKGQYSQEAINSLKSFHLTYAKNPPAFKPASQLKARGEERLGHVLPDGTVGAPKLRVASEADAMYLDWAASYTGSGEYVEQLKAGFLAEYGKYLDVEGDWLSSVKNLTPSPIAREVKAFRSQLRVLTNRQGAQVVWADKAKMAIADHFMANGLAHPKRAAAAEIFDNYIKPSGMLRGANRATSVAVLGMLNLVQFPLQMSFGLLTSTSTSLGRIAAGQSGQAKAMVAGMADFVQALGPMLYKTDMQHTKVGSEAFEFLKRTGVIDGVDYDDMARTLSDARVGRGGLSSAVKRGVEVAGVAFTKGELINQAYAALLSRRVMMAEINAGRHATLKVADLANGGSAKFMAEVMQRGKMLSLNMSRHNAPGFARNELTATVFKFKEFVSHSANLYLGDPFLSKTLTKAERNGLYAGSLLVLGPKGVPFLWDSLTMAEIIADEADIKAGNLPDNRGKFTSQMFIDASLKIEELTGGAMSAPDVYDYMVEGNIGALGTRAAAGAFFSDYVDAARMDEVLLGAVYTKMKNFSKSGFNTVEMAVDMLREDNVDYERLALEASQEITGVNNMLRFKESLDKDRILTKSGKTMVNNPTLAERLSIGGGLTPSQVTRAYDVSTLGFQQAETIKEWQTEQIADLTQTYQVNPKAADRHFDYIIAQLKETNPMLIPGFLKAYFVGIKGTAIDVEGQVVMRSIQKGMINADVNRVLGLRIR